MTSKDRILIFIKEIGIKQTDFFTLIRSLRQTLKETQRKVNLALIK